MSLKLAVLKNATHGDTTFYTGDDERDVQHLSNCTLLCRRTFDGLDNVEIRIVEDPQAEFYLLSHAVCDKYSFGNKGQNNPPIIGQNVTLGPGVVLGDGVVLEDDVVIGPNTVIYSKSRIGRGTSIDANCTIGGAGMMWVWHQDRKLYLKLLGGVRIGNDCVIGANTSVVRGNAKENTTIEDSVCLAPGCCIGHGCVIGKDSHLANNVTLGGGVKIGCKNFLGSSATILPKVVTEGPDIVLAAGATLTKSISEEGVYVGNPAKRLKSATGALAGIPRRG